MTNSFVHLHVHTHYSLLDGFSKIPELIKRAKELGMSALAITDHGTMFGVIEFYPDAAKAAGIKPIIGLEAYMAPRGMNDKDAQLDKRASHLLLLAENDIGYKNLLQIASAAQLDGFYYHPRIDKDFLASPFRRADRFLRLPEGSKISHHSDEARRGARRKLLDWYYGVFGPTAFSSNCSAIDIPELDEVNKSWWSCGSATTRALSPPTMCITLTARMRASRISCWPSRPARC